MFLCLLLGPLQFVAVVGSSSGGHRIFFFSFFFFFFFSLLIFIDVKMTGRGRGRRDALAIAVQTQSGQEEAEELVNGAAGGRGTEAEGREPTLSDLAAILQTHMGQQQARDEEQRELAEKGQLSLHGTSRRFM